MAIQARSRTQVSSGSDAISIIQMKAPIIGTKGTHGVRNPRGALGSVFRSIIIPKLTIINASKVPIETNSPNNPMGKKPAKNAENNPVTIVALCGVLNFGCTFAKLFQSRPSCAIM